MSRSGRGAGWGAEFRNSKHHDCNMMASHRLLKWLKHAACHTWLEWCIKKPWCLERSDHYLLSHFHPNSAKTRDFIAPHGSVQISGISPIKHGFTLGINMNQCTISYRSGYPSGIKLSQTWWQWEMLYKWRMVHCHVNEAMISHRKSIIHIPPLLISTIW